MPPCWRLAVFFGNVIRLMKQESRNLARPLLQFQAAPFPCLGSGVGGRCGRCSVRIRCVISFVIDKPQPFCAEKNPDRIASPKRPAGLSGVITKVAHDSRAFIKNGASRLGDWPHIVLQAPSAVPLGKIGWRTVASWSVAKHPLRLIGSLRLRTRRCDDSLGRRLRKST
jgi:hypothetical protein